MKFRHWGITQKKAYTTRFGAFKMWHLIAGLVVHEISKEYNAF
jgi:hypothetical protein